VLGERWTLLIVRELMTGPQRYSDLRDHLPGMWSNLLAQRLRDLEAAGLVQRTLREPPAGHCVYELTTRGRELAPVLYEMARFGLGYLDAPSDDQPLAPHLLTEGLRSLVLLEALPRRRLVAHLALDEGDYTLLVERPRPGPSLERVTVTSGAPPRPDVVVRSSAPVLLWLRRHDITYDDATAGDLINLDGTASAVDALRAAFGFSNAA
jgi:DNA-binding HxlR family transcriptional regulator